MPSLLICDIGPESPVGGICDIVRVLIFCHLDRRADSRDRRCSPWTFVSAACRNTTRKTCDDLHSSILALGNYKIIHALSSLKQGRTRSNRRTMYWTWTASVNLCMSEYLSGVLTPELISLQQGPVRTGKICTVYEQHWLTCVRNNILLQHPERSHTWPTRRIQGHCWSTSPSNRRKHPWLWCLLLPQSLLHLRHRLQSTVEYSSRCLADWCNACRIRWHRLGLLQL